MADVTLVIKADISNAVKGVNDLQKATQKLYDTSETSSKRRLGRIEQEEKAIANLTRLAKQSTETSQISQYNKLIDQRNEKLKEYNQLGRESAKQTDTLTQSIGKWALSLGGAAAILNILKDSFMKLTPVINTFNTVGAATNQVLYNIVTGTSNLTQGVLEAIKVQKVFNDLRLQEYRDRLDIQKKETEFQRKWSESLNAELSIKERIILVDEALKAKNEAIDIEIADALKERAANLNLLLNQQGNEEVYKAFYDSLTKIERLEEERFSSTKRLTKQQTALRKEERDNLMKGWFDEIEAQNKVNEDRLKQEQAYQQKVKELIEKYDQSNIETLTGKDKLKAQRDFGVKQIKELKDQIELLGPVTAEQMNMLQVMADNVWKAYYKALAEGAEKGEIKISTKEKEAISKALLGGMADLQGLQKSTITEAQKKQVEVAGQQGEGFSIWSLIGIDVDTEEGQKAMEGLIEAKDKMLGVIDEIYQARVDDATRRRELLDTQVSETQEELEAEMELMKAGYANNVDLKRKELEAIKKQRDIALKKEEEAIKRQRQLDTITQLSALVTSSANLFKSLSPLGPPGIVIAIATIASMFAAFAASKTKAAAATKLASGGSGTDTGIIKGRSHAYGGEQFLNHVEVEGGESWGVLSIPATQRFGKVFHHMVSSFNRGEIPDIVPVNRINNSVMVENSGPNSRLDQVVREQRKLNARLSGESVQDFGNVRVIRKGESIRTIKR